MGYAESELLPLSGLQHLLFCERQWGLIHIEQQWAENRLTAEGRLLHRKVDEVEHEKRNGVRICRGLALRSLEHGLSGKADVVEFPLDGGSPIPVEYKRGREKGTDVDRVQLCAQALCLEEMTGQEVAVGVLFYGEPRRRSVVRMDEELRKKTKALARRMHELYRIGKTASPVHLAHCRSCSLAEICQPQTLTERGSARTFVRRAVREQLQEGTS